MTKPFKAAEQSKHYVVERAVTEDEILQFAQQLIARKFKRGSKLNSPNDVQNYFMHKLSTLEHEVFCVLFMDNQHHVLAFEEMFRGTVNAANVYPREIVKQALLLNAAAIIIVHNHPSGEPEPSQSDRAITKQVKDAMALIDVRVLDHFIIGGDRCVSFAERGLL